MSFPTINIDFTEENINSPRNYKDELDKVVNNLKKDIDNIGDITKSQKSFFYAELLTSNAIKKANEIVNDMKNELLKKHFKSD